MVDGSLLHDEFEENHVGNDKEGDSETEVVYEELLYRWDKKAEYQEEKTYWYDSETRIVVDMVSTDMKFHMGDMVNIEVGNDDECEHKHDPYQWYRKSWNFYLSTKNNLYGRVQDDQKSSSHDSLMFFHQARKSVCCEDNEGDRDDQSRRENSHIVCHGRYCQDIIQT